MIDVHTDDPAKAAQVAHRYGQANPQPAHNTLNTAAGVAGEYADGILPGAGGAIRGIREVLLNAIRAPFSPTEDFHPREAYLKGQKFQEERQKEARAEHPRISGTASAAGMGAGLLLPATKIARGATMGARVAAGAKTAGAYGALSGLLSSKAKDLPGVVEDALSSGALSGVTGAAFPVAAHLAHNAVRPAAPFVEPVVQKIGQGIEAAAEWAGEHAPEWLKDAGAYLARDRNLARAHQIVAQDLSDAVNPATGRNWTPPEVAQEVARRHQMGVPAAPADIHESARRSYGAAARVPGPATAAVRRAIDKRQEQSTQRVADHISDTLGATTNVEAQADALRQHARETSAPLYEISNDQHIPFVNELQNLFRTPSGHEALQTAGRELRDRQENLSEYGLVQGADGVFHLGKAPTMKMYDLAKQVLDQGIYAGDKPFASDTATSFGKGARDIRRQLLAIMDGDGSGPRIPQAPEALPSPQAPSGVLPALGQPALPNGTPGTPQALPASASRLPVPPPNLRSNLPDAPATVLRPEQPAVPPMGPAAGPGSAIPPEGLNPFWKPAREAYGGPIQAKKALEMGDALAGGDAEEAANRMARMTGVQQDFFRLGHRSQLAKDVKSLGDWGNAAARVGGSLQKRDALSTVHGLEAAQDLLDRTNAEHEAHQTWKMVRGNSQTPDRAAEIAAQDAQIAAAAGGILQWAAGHPGGGAMTAIKGILQGERGNEVKGPIAQILGDTNPDRVAKNLTDAAREADRQGALSLFRNVGVLHSSRLLGSTLGTNMIQPALQGF